MLISGGKDQLRNHNLQNGDFHERFVLCFIHFEPLSARVMAVKLVETLTNLNLTMFEEM